MIDLPTLTGESAIYGLGRSGLAAAYALRAAGCDVVAWDDNKDARTQAETIPMRDLSQTLGRPARLVVAPGVALSHPLVQAAQAAQVEIIGDIDLFQMARAAMSDDANDICVIGVTGTNGKSTTTALIGYMLAQAGWQVQMGGNIGTPVLSLDMPQAGQKTAYVLELSSYQLELNRHLRADIGVWLNLTPDHLERHGTMESYAATKAHLFDATDNMRAAIIGCDDDYGTALANRAMACPITRFATRHAHADFGFDGRWLTHKGQQAVDMMTTRALRGVHNAQNAAAAYAVGLALDIDAATIAQALRDFPGLAHRLQPVADYQGIAFVNDSKATNIEAARHALAAFHNIYWIAGGRSKEKTLCGLDALYNHITRAYFIGEAADAFAAECRAHVPCVIAGELAYAVGKAADDAKADATGAATVLLSPACASFDQFADFEERGNAFCHAVKDWIATQDANQERGA